MGIGRRGFVVGGSAAFIVSLTCSPEARAAALGETRLINRDAVAAAEAASPLDFDLFYDLSRYITARAQLDRSVARRLHAHFREEEWGHVIAARAYEALRRETADGTRSGPDVLAARRFSDLDQWYCEHILDAWYEGMYRYEGSEVRVIYEEALMWTLVDDVLPVRGAADTEYGFWGEPPVTEADK